MAADQKFIITLCLISAALFLSLLGMAFAADGLAGVNGCTTQVTFDSVAACGSIQLILTLGLMGMYAFELFKAVKKSEVPKPMRIAIWCAAGAWFVVALIHTIVWSVENVGCAYLFSTSTLALSILVGGIEITLFVLKKKGIV